LSGNPNASPPPAAVLEIRNLRRETVVLFAVAVMARLLKPCCR
jgi:hypothetical protein